MTEDEARNVIGNSQNPLHEGFNQNRPEVVAEVNAAFERAYPGEQDTGKGSTSLNEPMAAALADTPGGAEIEAESPMLAKLRDHWGGEFEGKFDTAREAFQSFPLSRVKEIEKAYPGIGSDVRVYDLLVDLRKRGR